MSMSVDVKDNGAFLLSELAIIEFNGPADSIICILVIFGMLLYLMLHYFVGLWGRPSTASGCRKVVELSIYMFFLEN